MPPCHSSAGRGHTRWALIGADFPGQTEKCHLSRRTVARQHHRARSLLALHTQAMGQGGNERWEESTEEEKNNSNSTEPASAIPGSV